MQYLGFLFRFEVINLEQPNLSYNLDITPKSVWLTVTASPSIRNSFAYVQELGDFYCGGEYYTRRKNLPSFLIKLTLSGQGRLEYNNNIYTIKPGNLFWIDCTKPQYYYTSPDTDHWHTLWVHFYGPTAVSYHESFIEQNADSPLILSDPSTKFSDIFEKLIRLYGYQSTSLQDDLYASSLLTQLMVNCIRTVLDNKISNHHREDYFLSIQNYIDENYQENLNLDHLAQQFSINKYYLQKQFKKKLGFSPNEYLTRIRLEKAKTLLRTTDDTIIQIAQEVGYTASYFDNVFKKYEGVTPHIYRLQWYDSENDL